MSAKKRGPDVNAEAQNCTFEQPLQGGNSGGQRPERMLSAPGCTNEAHAWLPCEKGLGSAAPSSPWTTAAQICAPAISRQQCHGLPVAEVTSVSMPIQFWIG